MVNSEPHTFRKGKVRFWNEESDDPTYPDVAISKSKSTLTLDHSFHEVLTSFKAAMDTPADRVDAALTVDADLFSSGSDEEIDARNVGTFSLLSVLPDRAEKADHERISLYDERLHGSTRYSDSRKSRARDDDYQRQSVIEDSSYSPFNKTEVYPLPVRNISSSEEASEVILSSDDVSERDDTSVHSFESWAMRQLESGLPESEQGVQLTWDVMDDRSDRCIDLVEEGQSFDLEASYSEYNDDDDEEAVTAVGMFIQDEEPKGAVPLHFTDADFDVASYEAEKRHQPHQLKSMTIETLEQGNISVEDEDHILPHDGVERRRVMWALVISSCCSMVVTISLVAYLVVTS